MQFEMGDLEFGMISIVDGSVPFNYRFFKSAPGSYRLLNPSEWTGKIVNKVSIFFNYWTKYLVNSSPPHNAHVINLFTKPQFCSLPFPVGFIPLPKG